jgi:type IV secretory pathway TrbF-like protein
VVPYIVELDAEGGVHRVMDARAFADYRPRQGAVQRQIADWITWVRSLSSDPVVVRARWLRAYHFLTTEGASRLNAYAKAEDPFTRAGKETVAVDLSTVVPLSDRTFEAQWTETRHTRGRGTEVAEPYVGVFTVRIVPPQDEEQAFQNPLGIRIDEFNWSRRY